MPLTIGSKVVPSTYLVLALLRAQTATSIGSGFCYCCCVQRTCDCGAVANRLWRKHTMSCTWHAVGADESVVGVGAHVDIHITLAQQYSLHREPGRRRTER